MAFPRNLDLATLLTNYILPQGREGSLDEKSGPNELVQNITSKAEGHLKARKLLKPFRDIPNNHIRNLFKGKYRAEVRRLIPLAKKRGITEQKLPGVLANIMFSVLPRLEKRLEEKTIPELMQSFVKDKDNVVGNRLAKRLKNREEVPDKEIKESGITSEQLVDAFYNMSPSPMGSSVTPFTGEGQVNEMLKKMNRGVQMKTSLVILTYANLDGEPTKMISYIPTGKISKGNNAQYSYLGIKDARETVTDAQGNTKPAPKYVSVYYPRLWWLLRASMRGKIPEEYETPITFKVQTSQENETGSETHTVNDSPLLAYNYFQMLKGVKSSYQAGDTFSKRKELVPSIEGRVIKNYDKSPLIKKFGKGLALNPVMLQILKEPYYLNSIIEGSGLSDAEVQVQFEDVTNLGVNPELRAFRINSQFKDNFLEVLAEDEEFAKEKFYSKEPKSGGFYILFETENLAKIKEIVDEVSETLGKEAFSEIIVPVRKDTTRDNRNFREVDDPDATYQDHIHSLTLIGTQANPSIRQKIKDGNTNRAFLLDLEKAIKSVVDNIKNGVRSKVEDIIENPETYKKIVDEDIFNILAQYEIIQGSQ